MKLSKNAGLLLLAAGAGAAWWWWKNRGGGAAGDVAKAEEAKPINIGQAGSNIGLTGDQVGTLIEKFIDQTAPYDQVRLIHEGGHRVFQARYGGQGEWVNVDFPHETGTGSITEVCAKYGLNCRDN